MNAQGCICNQSLSRIANLGSRGRYVNNIWRDAQALFGNVKVIHPKTHCLPLKNGKAVRPSASPSFWPHQLSLDEGSNSAWVAEQYGCIWQRHVTKSVRTEACSQSSEEHMLASKVMFQSLQGGYASMHGSCGQPDGPDVSEVRAILKMSAKLL